MTPPLDPQRAAEFQALDDLASGHITEAEFKEYIGDDWAVVVEGASYNTAECGDPSACKSCKYINLCKGETE